MWFYDPYEAQWLRERAERRVAARADPRRAPPRRAPTRRHLFGRPLVAVHALIRAARRAPRAADATTRPDDRAVTRTTDIPLSRAASTVAARTGTRREPR